MADHYYQKHFIFNILQLYYYKYSRLQRREIRKIQRVKQAKTRTKYIQKNLVLKIVVSAKYLRLLSFTMTVFGRAD